MKSLIKSPSTLAWILISFYILLYLLPLGFRPLLLPDEARYAEIPREMLASGEWLVPHLNGLRYFEKPPLGYWTHAISIAVFGENPFAVRLPNALAVGFTALLIYLFSFRVLKQRSVALLAVLVYLSFFEVYFVGTFAVLDNLLSLFLTAGLLAVFVGNSSDPPQQRRWWLAAGCAFGLAFLTKGFLAFVIPVLVFVPWFAWQKQWTRLLVAGGWCLLSAFIVVLPWAILIHLREPDFWHYFFWIEHIKRFSADQAQHHAPVYYFLVWLPALAFPWITLLPAVITGLNLKKSVEVGSPPPIPQTFLWLWVVLPILFFSASNGKLATYILPIFPPAAILIATGLSRYFSHGRSTLFDLGALFNALTLLLLVVALWMTQFHDIGKPLFTESEKGTLWALLILLAVGAIGGIVALSANQATRKILAVPIVLLPAMIAIWTTIPQRTLASKAPGEILIAVKTEINDKTLIISTGSVIRAVNWYLKRNDVSLVTPHELKYGLSYPDAKHRLLNPAQFQQQLNSALLQGRSVLLVCKRDCPHQLDKALPASNQHFSNGVLNLWLVKP